MPPRRSTSRRRSASTTRKSRRGSSTPRKNTKKDTQANSAATTSPSKIALKAEASAVNRVLSGHSGCSATCSSKSYWLAVIALLVVALAWACWTFELCAQLQRMWKG